MSEATRKDYAKECLAVFFIVSLILANFLLLWIDL
jgi:hypothetical protein